MTRLLFALALSGCAAIAGLAAVPAQALPVAAPLASPATEAATPEGLPIQLAQQRRGPPNDDPHWHRNLRHNPHWNKQPPRTVCRTYWDRNGNRTRRCHRR